MRRLPPALPIASIVLAGCLGLAVRPAAAQSTDWSALAVVQPFPSPFLGDWDRYPSTGLLTVTYTGTAPASYRVRVTLTHESRGEFGVVESPEQSVPGGASSQAFLASEIARWPVLRRQSGLVSEITRTGVLPEGRYRACGQVVLGQTRAQAAEACAEFTIALPEPPRLLAPDQGAVVAGTQPIMQWTPVLVPPPLQIRYRVKVVELIGSQQPVVALAANIPMLDVTTTAPFLIYPIDALPLEPEKRYAWQVQAVDADGRQFARTQVLSEIYQFSTANDLSRPPPLLAELPDEVELLPGTARLTGLRAARARRSDVDVTVDGRLTLVLDALGGARLPVTVRDLRLGFRGADLRVTNGGFTLPLPSELLPERVRDLVRGDQLRYDATTGFSGTARVELPGRGAIPLDGTLTLTAAGWYGRLVGALPDGRTLPPLGRAPVTLAVTGADLLLPMGTLKLQGQMKLFGQDVGCRSVTGEVDRGVMRTGGFCEPSQAVQLAGDGPADLQVGAFGGALVADFPGDNLDYTLEAPATLRLLGTWETPCQATVTLTMRPGTLATRDNRTRCDPNEAIQRLGWLELRYGRLELLRLEFSPERGLEWGAIADIEPRLVAAPTQTLGTFIRTAFDREGMTLPLLSETMLRGDDVELAGLRFAITGVRHPQTTLTWAQYKTADAAPYRFTLEGSVRFVGDGSAPWGCLGGTPSPMATPATLAGGAISLTVRFSRYARACRVEVAPGIMSVISGWGGDVRLNLTPRPVMATAPFVYGFVTGSGRPNGVQGCAYDLGGAMRLTPAGRLIGTITARPPEINFDVADLRELADLLPRAFGQVASTRKSCDISLGFGDLVLDEKLPTFGVDADGAQTAMYVGSALAKLKLTKAAEDSVAAAEAEKKDAKEAEKGAAEKSGVPVGEVAAQAGALKDQVTGELKPAGPGQARADIEFDWIKGELLSGTFVIKSQVEISVGSLRFEVRDVQLDRRGLSVRGRHAMRALGLDLGRAMWVREGNGTVREQQDTLGIALTGRIPAVFDGVVLNPGRLDLGQGTIRMDEPFSLLAASALPDTKEDGVLARAEQIDRAASVMINAVTAVMGNPSFDPVPDAITKNPLFKANLQKQAFHIWLPVTGATTIDRDGLRLPDGTATADLAFLKSRFEGVSLTYRNNVGFQPATRRVASGSILFNYRDYPVAVLDAQGFRPAVAELVEKLIPARLPLPTEQVAYLQLRGEDGKLLVDVQELDDGYAVTTRAGAPVQLVVPALQGSRPQAPTVGVSLAIELAANDLHVRDGTIKAIVTNRDGFDLRPLQLPLALDSVVYQRGPGADYTFSVGGKLLLFGDAQPLADVAVAFDAGGNLAATIDKQLNERFPMLTDSDRLALRVRRLTGTFSGRLGGNATYQLDAEGGIELTPPSGPVQTFDATLRSTPQRFEVVNVAISRQVPLLDIDGVRLLLGNPRLPLLRYDYGTRSWAFRVLFDLGLQFPQLGSLVLPPIPDIELSSSGLSIPAFEASAITPTALRTGAFGIGNTLVNDGVAVQGFAVRPLAYRISAFRWDFLRQAPFPTNWGFGVDLAVRLADVAPDAPEALRGLELRALDVGVRNGILGGRLELQTLPTPVPLAGFELTKLWGRFGVDLRAATAAAALEPLSRTAIFAEVAVRVPEAMACNALPADRKFRFVDALRTAPSTAAPTGATPSGAGGDGLRGTLELNGAGFLTGTISTFTPDCGGRLGPFGYRLTNTRLEFGAAQGAQALALTGTAQLKLPGFVGNDSITVNGTLGVDFITGEVGEAAFAIAQPFRLPLGGAEKFVALRVEQASIDKTGFSINGSGALLLGDGSDAVTVSYVGTRIGFAPLQVTAGQVQFGSAFSIGVGIGASGALEWGTAAATAPRPAGPSFRLAVPANAVLEADGLALTGSAVATLGFGTNDYASLAAEFSEGFRIGFDPVGVKNGVLTFRGTGGETIATVDRLGFWPGNVFAALPLPERLPVPSLDVAYLVLREGGPTGRVLVENTAIPNSGNIRVATRGTETVQLVLPALADGSTAPAINVRFSLDVNPQLMRVVGGSFTVETPSGQPSLIPLPSLPLLLTKLAFEAGPGGYQLKADAKVKLPASLTSMPVVFRNLVLSAQGFTGTAELGTWKPAYDPSLPAAVTAGFLNDSLQIMLTGVRATFAPANNRVALAGYIRSKLFAAPNGPASTLFLSATASRTGFTGAVDFSPLPNNTLPLGVAAFTPQAINGKPALVLTATDQEFALTLGGTFTLPTVAPGFSVAVEDLKLSTLGITVPTISITAPTETQQFDLFGAQFRLKDSTAGGVQVVPAVAIGIGNGVVSFTLSGDVTILRNTTRFVGLTVNSLGQFGLTGASLLSRSLAVIPDRLFLDQLAIDDGALVVGVSAELPEPLVQGKQSGEIRIAPDGTISGGADLTIVSVAEGTTNPSLAATLGDFTIQLRRVDINFGARAGEPFDAEVRIAADVAVKDGGPGRIRMGRVTGGTMVPGLTISGARGVEWGGLDLTNTITFNYQMLRLTLQQATVRASSTVLLIDLSGRLTVNLEQVSGELGFTNVGLSSTGGLTIGTGQIDDGRITVAGKFSLSIRNVRYLDTPTSIEIPKDRAPGGDGRVTSSAMETVQVSSYLSLGGSLDIVGVFNGGVERVIVYREAGDNSVHLLVDRLNVNIPKTLSFVGSLRYDQMPDGFEVVVGASAKVLDTFGAAMVGVLSQRASSFRAGLFVSVTAPIPLVPGVVTLTAVGGGFFINPLSSDLSLVRTVANLDTKSAARIGPPPGGKFAILLYAGVAVAGKGQASAVEGRALVTITDQIFRLDGSAKFFGQGDRLEGDLALQVGFDPAYVRGNIDFRMAFDSVATGAGQLEFAAGGGLFAVRGQSRFTIVKIIIAEGNFAVTPSGMMIRTSATLEAKALTLFTIRGSLGGALWFRPPDDIGAYVQLAASIDIGGGAAGLEGELKGALTVKPKLALFAQGRVRAYALGAQLPVQVWASWTSTGLNGGLGENAEMREAIANANRVMQELDRQARDILAQIAQMSGDGRGQPIAVSEATLRRAWTNISQFRNGENALQIIQLLGFALQEQQERSLPGGLGQDPALDRSVNILLQRMAPNDTAEVSRLRTELEQKLAVVAARRVQAEQQLAALTAQVDELEALTFAPIEDPVTNFSDDAVVFTPGTVGADGRTEMVASGGPGFELDNAKANAGRSAAESGRDAVAQRAEKLREKLVAAEALLTRTRAATTDPASAALLGYARLHSDAVALAEQQQATLVDLVQRRRDWIRGERNWLIGERTPLQTRLRARMQAMLDAERMPLRRVQMAIDLTKFRARTLQSWSGDGSQLQAVQAQEAINKTDPAWYLDNATLLGVRLWADVGITGLRVMDSVAGSEVTQAVTAADAALGPVRSAQLVFSNQLDQLLGRQAELTGALYDLYDQAIRELGTAGNQDLVARRTELAALLPAPTVTSSTVQISDFGFRTRIRATWTGTHPRGVFAYAAGLGGTPVLTGGTGSYERWIWPGDDVVLAVPGTMTMRVRGGAGFLGQQGVPFTATFKSGTPSAPSVSTAAPVTDATPPSQPVVSFPGRTPLVEPFLGARVFTSDADQILVEWNAADAESGIQSYEYRLVSVSPNWTLLELRGWTPMGGRSRATLSGLALMPGMRVAVQVRARNGANLVSTEGISPMLVLDRTGPVWPAFAGLRQFGQSTYVFPSAPILSPACPAAPAGGSVNPFLMDRGVGGGGLMTAADLNAPPAPVGGNATGTLLVIVPEATDAESFVSGYRIFVGDAMPTGTDGPGWSPVTRGPLSTVSVPDVPYGTPRTIVVVAVNGAGVASAPLTMVTAMPDPSEPSRATACAGAGGANELTLRFSSLATDPESGVLGYQVRVLNSAGAVLRDFPTGNAIDIRADRLSLNTPTNTGVTLPGAVGLQIQYRAINGAGYVGQANGSGPLTADPTPPPTPGISGTWTSNRVARSLTLTVSTGSDPESGLASMQWALGSTPGGSDLQPWTPLVAMPNTVQQVPYGQFFMLGARGQVLYASVRVTNGAGMSSAVGQATLVVP